MPFDPPKVLKIFGETQDAAPGPIETDGRSSNSPGSCFDSPSATRRLRKVVNASVARTDKKTQKTLGKLGDAVLVLSAKLTLVELRNKQFDATLRHERKRRRRVRVLMEEFRASEGSGALFMSPTNIHRAQELQTRREQEKTQLQRDKERRRQDKSDLKVQKAEEAREKRVERAAAAEAKRTATAQRKAAAAEARVAKKAETWLQDSSKALGRLPRGLPKKQPKASRPETSSGDIQSEEPGKGRVSRSGRILRRSAWVNE